MASAREAVIGGVTALDVEALVTGPAEREHQAVRLERICRIQRLIESGEYDNEARLQAALERLLDEMM